MTLEEKVRAYLIDCISPCYQPRETRPAGDWARETITLALGENKKFAGQPYDISRTPYNNRLFTFIQSQTERELITVKGSQCGFTLAVFVTIAWLLKHAPGNIFYVTDSLPNARELGKRRLTPILRCISDEVADRLDDGDQTGVNKEVNGAIIRLTGAQAISGFISWPVSYGFVDEAETHELLEEGSTIALTRARFKNDDEHKFVVFSKPQDEPTYEVDKTTGRKKLTSGRGTLTMDEYYSGSQEKLRVPCPHCGMEQELVWANIRYEHCRTSLPGILPVEYDTDRVLTDTYYECAFCQGKIEEHHKSAIVNAGTWHPTPEADRLGPYKKPVPKRISCHISDLYVFSFEQVRWGHLASKWIEAQGDDNKLEAFYNDHLALPRPRKKATGLLTLTAAERLLSAYPRLDLYDDRKKWQGAQHPLPIEPVFAGVAIDKQDGYFKFTAGVFDRRGELYVIDWGTLADFDDVSALLSDFTAQSPSGVQGGFYAGLMDCGYSRGSVIDYCFAIRGLIPYFAPSRGWKEIANKGTIWPTDDTSKPGRIVQIVNFDSQYWETDLYRYRIAEFNPHRPRRRSPRIHLPHNTTDDFLKEITNAQQVSTANKYGINSKLMWGKARPHDPNDYGDTLKNLLLLWALHGPEEIQSEETTDEPAKAA